MDKFNFNSFKKRSLICLFQQLREISFFLEKIKYRKLFQTITRAYINILVHEFRAENIIHNTPERMRSLLRITAILIASGGESGKIYLWDIILGNLEKTFTCQKDIIICLENLDEEVFASGSKDLSVALWNWFSGKCIKVIRINTDFVTSIIKLDKVSFAIGSLDKTINIHDIQNGNCLNTLNNEYPTNCLLYLNNKKFVSAHRGFIKIWDTKKGECLKAVEAHKNAEIVILSLIQINDNKIASSCNDALIRIWDLPHLTYAKTIRHTENSINTNILLSLNEYRFANICNNYTIKIWDSTTGSCLKVMSPPGISFLSCMIKLGEYRIVTGSDDNYITSWDFY